MRELTEMKQAPGGDVWLYSSSYTKEWTCKFEGRVDDLKVEIMNTAPTHEEAVQLTYMSFLILASRVKEITAPLLEAPARDDDGIPF